MLFGIYHTAYEKIKDKFYDVIDSNLVNTIIVESYYESEEFKISLDKLKTKENISVWISVGYLGFVSRNNVTIADNNEQDSIFNPQTTFLSDYKDRVDRFINFLKEHDYYNHVVGFYMDEPLLWNIKNDWLEEFTKYFRTKAAIDKRFFICFSVAGVAPSIWTINDVKPITPKSSKYLTDIAFDMYHKWSEDYDKITDFMLQRSGNRQDLKVWMIPCTMNYRGTYKEEYAIEHLEKCYQRLKQFPNPGGLMCYTYYTFPVEKEDLGNEGLDVIANKESGKYWPNLVNKIKEISKEIIGEADGNEISWP